MRAKTFHTYSTQIISLIFLMISAALPTYLPGQPLMGTYTIGGTSPNYPNFTQAVNDLHAKGVKGPVTFLVRPGTYNERFQINAITGAGPESRITFRGQGNPQEQVITGTPIGPSDHHIIKLSGADYLSFERLTLINPAVVYGSGFYLTEHADHNDFRDLVIKMDTTAETANTAGVLITGPGTSTSLIAQGNSGSHLNFKRVTIWGGDASFWLSGGLNISSIPPSVLDSVIFIDSCTFIHGLRRGLDIQLYGRVSVSNCTIKPSHAAPLSGMTGMQLLQVGNTQVWNNKIFSRGEVGLQVLCDFAAGAYVANNFVMHFYYPQYTTVHGLAIRSGFMKSRVINNSIWFDNEPGDSLDPGNRYNHAALRHYAGTVLLMNNSVYNQGPGYAFVSENPGIDSMDHNNYYSTSTRYILWQGSPHNTLAQHQNNTGKDKNSRNVLPGYISKSDLHASGTALNGRGIYLNYNSLDIDGEARAMNGPDIGADEFVPPGADLGIWDINPRRAFVGTNKVEVTLANQGTVSLDGKSLQLEYSVDSGKTWTAPENITTNSLGAPGDKQKYHFNTPWSAVQQGSVDLCARIKSPGYPGDVNSLNDYRCVKSCVGDSSQVFRIGPDRDFKLISEVIAHLLSAGCGVVRPMVFLVDSGVYEDLVYLPPIPGMHRENTVTFKGATGRAEDVVIKAQGKGTGTDHAILNFREGHHYIFEDLKVWNTHKDTASVIHLPSFSKSNVFRGCIFKLDSGVSNARFGCYMGQLRGGYVPLAFEADSNLFERCRFEGGYTGFKYSSGSYFFFKEARGNRIINNKFLDQSGEGIRIEGTGVVELAHNICRSQSTEPGSRGIMVHKSPDLMSIHANQVLGAYSIGIDISDPSSGLLLYNNAVALNPRGQSTTYGISLENPGMARVMHNSVYLGPRSDPDSRAWLLLNSVSCSVANNLFINEGKGTAAYVFPDESGLFSDRNVWYTTGSKLAFWGSDYTNLAALRAGTGKEKTGFEFLPKFKDTLDLHTNDQRLDSAGLSMEIVQDWEGDPRDMIFPDLGADEFGAPPINTISGKLADFRYIVYPNPLSGNSKILFIGFESDLLQDNGPINVSITDPTGKVCWLNSFYRSDNNKGILEIRLSQTKSGTNQGQLRPGFYLIRMQTKSAPTHIYPLIIE